MRRLHLIEAKIVEQGIVYQASEEATAFSDSMRTPYSRALKERAKWLALNFLTGRSDEEIAQLINARIGLWSVEFQGNIGPISEAT